MTSKSIVKPRTDVAKAPQRILEAAKRMLVEQDGHMEIDQLAAAAGCSAGLIYHHFGSKAGLVAVIVGEFNEALSAMEPPGRGTSRREWLDRLHARCDAIVAAMYTNPLTRIIVAETIKDASAAAATERWLRVHITELTEDLGGARRLGYLGKEMDPELIAAGIAGGLRQIMRVVVSRAKLPKLPAVQRDAWRFVEACLHAAGSVTGDAS